ncbi:MAG: hypothetical protein HY897_14785 [Deltaproteobacteria bacterium]|nr:hypothetical protein [Deltaproteobacteria bacterium]
MWAAYLLDEDGNDFGIIRAGHTVRVLETGVGKDGKLSKVEIEKPFKLTAFVPSTKLLVFTKQEIDVVPGFSSVLGGAPVHVESAGAGKPSISAAACCCDDDAWKTIVVCDRLTPIPNIATRDNCYGAHASVTLKWVGHDHVYWDDDVEIVSVDGKNRRGLPREYYVPLIEICGEYAHVGYYDSRTSTVFHGLVPLAGMKEATGGQAIGGCCCPSVRSPTEKIRTWILGHWDPSMPKSSDSNLQRAERKRLQASPKARRNPAWDLPWAKLKDPAAFRGREGGAVLTTLPAGAMAYTGDSSENMTFVGLRWPTWDDNEFTLELFGYVESKNVERLPPEPEVK